MGRFAKRVRKRAVSGGVPMRKVNGYVCRDCGETTWTVDIHQGVTPGMMLCKTTPDCNGMAMSRFYRVPPNHPTPTHEWYRPSASKARREDAKYPGMLQHYEQGGLFLRPRRTA